MKTDTIAAIATAMSNSGIGIVRISGDEALDVADRISSKKGSRKVSDMETHTIHYGYVTDGDEVIDEVMLLIMKHPAVIPAKIPSRLTVTVVYWL